MHIGHNLIRYQVLHDGWQKESGTPKCISGEGRRCVHYR